MKKGFGGKIIKYIITGGIGIVEILMVLSLAEDLNELIALILAFSIINLMLINVVSRRNDGIDLKIPIGYPPANPDNRPFGSGGFVTGGCIEADHGSSLKNYEKNNASRD